MPVFTDALRLGAVRFVRGTIGRKACIGAIKMIRRGRGLPAGIAEVRPLDRPDIAFEPTDSMVVDSIYWFGVQGYEGRMADVWVSLCSTAHNVVEIGANVGLFTVLGGLAAQGTYVAVEPLPENAAVLRRNLARNQLSDAVDVRQAAAIASTVEMPVEINVPDEGREAPVGAHVTKGSEVAERSSARVISVPGLPFSNLVAQADLIKIDAEGIEAELLRSAADQIAHNRPTMVIEVLAESNRLAVLIGKFAAEHGYTINVIPSYGSNVIVTVDPAQFRADTPRQYKSKDVVLAHGALV